MDTSKREIESNLKTDAPNIDARLAELKILVHDKNYISGAIDRLAIKLSEEIMDGLGVGRGK